MWKHPVRRPRVVEVIRVEEADTPVAVVTSARHNVRFEGAGLQSRRNHGKKRAALAAEGMLEAP
jgi:hypothetical protein